MMNTDTTGERGTLRWADYGRIVPYILPYWRRLGLLLLIGLVSTALSLIQPYFAKLLIDDALLNRDMNVLLLVAALLVAVTTGGFALTIVSGYSYVKVSAEVLFDMRLAVYRHLQRLSPRFYARTKLGDIVSRINNDIAEIQRVSADTILSLLSSLIFLVGSIIIMVWLDWRLFLLGISVLPLSAWALRHYQRLLTGRVRLLRERSAEIGSFLIETLIGIRLVVTSNAEQYEVHRFSTRNQRFIEALLSMQLASRLAVALPGTLLSIATAAVLLYGGKRVIDQDITVGVLVAFMAYYLRLTAPIQNLFGLYTNLATARVSLARVFELLDSPVDVCERPGAPPMTSVEGEVVFDGVTLKHDRGENVLDGVSFQVRAGSICAIVGPSGGGKSTVADMIVRFYDPDHGAVKIDGRDIRDMRLVDLRRAVALVDQSPYLFNTSIRENIAYAQPGTSEEDIIAAARLAALHDFIAALPDGYDTEVGERGLNLSAGERQRLSIARALLRNPSILVLDEPTSALDASTAKALANTLRQLLPGRTAIVLTHDNRLIETADQVVVLDGGRVMEAGPPAQLLARDGPLVRLLGSDVLTVPEGRR